MHGGQFAAREREREREEKWCLLVGSGSFLLLFVAFSCIKASKKREGERKKKKWFVAIAGQFNVNATVLVNKGSPQLHSHPRSIFFHIVTFIWV